RASASYGRGCAKAQGLWGHTGARRGPGLDRAGGQCGPSRKLTFLDLGQLGGFGVAHRRRRQGPPGRQSRRPRTDSPSRTRIGLDRRHFHPLGNRGPHRREDRVGGARGEPTLSWAAPRRSGLEQGKRLVPKSHLGEEISTLSDALESFFAIDLQRLGIAGSEASLDLLPAHWGRDPGEG